MQTNASQPQWLIRLAYLLSVMGLVIALAAPSAVVAQFKDDDRDEDEATEEADLEEEEDESDASDWEAAGLISETEYESPLFGYEMEWSDDWGLDLFYDQPENDIQPVMSSEADGFDRIYIAWFGEPDAGVWNTITGQDANRGSLEEEVEAWTDPDYIQENWLDSNPEYVVEAILDDTTSDSAAVVYSLLDTGNDDAVYYIVYMAVYRDDYTLYVSFTAYEDNFEDGYAALDEIEVDGEPLFTFLDWDDIEEAIDAA